MGLLLYFIGMLLKSFMFMKIYNWHIASVLNTGDITYRGSVIFIMILTFVLYNKQDTVYDDEKTGFLADTIIYILLFFILYLLHIL